jgi:hypothetical protein
VSNRTIEEAEGVVNILAWTATGRRDLLGDFF